MVMATWPSGYAMVDRYSLGSIPAMVMLLCSWERHFAIIFFAWRFNKQYQIAVLRISIKIKTK